LSDTKDSLNEEFSSQDSLNELVQIGELLRKSRLERNISIKELANSLRIGEEQLTAIESGQKELLPESVFVKAMIRRIAEKLAITDDPFLKELETPKDLIIQTTSEEISGKNLTKPNLLILPSIIVGIVVIVLGAKLIKIEGSRIPTSNPQSHSSFVEIK